MLRRLSITRQNHHKFIGTKHKDEAYIYTRTESNTCDTHRIDAWCQHKYYLMFIIESKYFRLSLDNMKVPVYIMSSLPNICSSFDPILWSENETQKEKTHCPKKLLLILNSPSEYQKFPLLLALQTKQFSCTINTSRRAFVKKAIHRFVVCKNCSINAWPKVIWFLCQTS